MKHIKKALCLLAAFIFVLSAASCSDTAAKADSVVMTDIGGVSVREYTTADQTFYAQGKISNASEGTKIRFVWTYTTENQIIDQLEYSARQSSEVIPAALTTNDSFPAGDYKLELFVGNRKEPDVTTAFKVKQLPPARIEDACMTSKIDENGQPQDNISIMNTTGTWYVCAVLQDTNPNTTVRFVWLDTNGKSIGESTVDPQGQSNIIVSGSLPLSRTMPDGDYQVEIYLDDKTEPEMTVSFVVKEESPYDLAAQNADYTLFTKTENGYSIDYPTDWIAYSEPDSSITSFYPMISASSRVNDINRVMVAKISNASGTIDGALGMWVGTVEACHYDDYVMLKVATDTFDGHDVAFFEFTWSGDGYDLHTFDYIIVNGTDFFLITLTSTEADYEMLLPYAIYMMSTLEIL